MPIIERLINLLPQRLRERLMELPSAETNGAGISPPSRPEVLAKPPQTGHTPGVTAAAQPRTPDSLTTLIGTDIKTEQDVTITQRAKQQGIYIIGAKRT